ncbi:MAG: hypothetical protein GHHEDOFH_02359 [Pseudorhodoplanes sp.]|mgnify:CR=1 FL=1|nr:hypothetical protein [Pseudorhodoplanes sp.]
MRGLDDKLTLYIGVNIDLTGQVGRFAEDNAV